MGAPITFEEGEIRRMPMSNIHRRIAENLVAAQRTAAMLTTFNEIEMTAVLDLRTRYGERFRHVHGVSLGLMPFFARACTFALQEFPIVNARIDGDDIAYHAHVHLGIAVSTERGLVVPVLRHAETMSLARLEAEIERRAAAAREGKVAIQDLSGGTFTITNGGVFGSLLSTPVLNPPQSAILGMHAIQKRPLAVDERLEIRPMMYVALSYDHRLIDGREAVLFLVRIKNLIEDPPRLLLEV
jgi:2-oxoglutarate dehydrogenase E2 component (dihydrolipoamide succinyltransferase)